MDKQLTFLKDVLALFAVPGTLEDAAEISDGHINRTYRLDVRDGERLVSYIAQNVNTYVFTRPAEVMANISLVTAELRRVCPDRVSLVYESSKWGLNYAYDDDGGFWRLCNYVDSVSYNSGADAEILRRSGRAFGEFQKLLSALEPKQLFETIPDFHNTRQRFKNLKAAVEKNASGRAGEVTKELEYYLSIEDTACTLTDLYDAGQLPLRVTHNDTKTNNILFDKDTHEPLVIIDLDTVMPGLVGHDFGDSIRFSGNPEAEDCTELEKVHLDMDIFDAYADGFLSSAAKTLTEKEIETLALSAFVLTVENGIRFLTDHIDGDVYFRIHREGQNLDRSRCQMALAQDMMRRMDEMNAIVRKYAEKYRA